MSIEGRIAVDVSFADSATSGGVQAIKKIQLVDTTAYTTGKVAVMTGTVGTASVTIGYAPTTYRNAAGDFVSFVTVSRAVFKATRPCLIDDTINNLENQAFCVFEPGDDLTLTCLQTAGTASYTLVLYGT